MQFSSFVIFNPCYICKVYQRENADVIHLITYTNEDSVNVLDIDTLGKPELDTTESSHFKSLADLNIVITPWPEQSSATLLLGHFERSMYG